MAFGYNLPVLWRRLHAYYTRNELGGRKGIDRGLSGKKDKLQARFQERPCLAVEGAPLEIGFVNKLKSEFFS